MTRDALFDAILHAMARASVGDRSEPIVVGDDDQEREPELSAIAYALNILLGDLEHLTRETLQARRALAESEKMSALGALTSGVAHELRTPLTYISNSLAMIERRALPLAERLGDAEAEREIRALVALANEGVHRASRIIDELRRYARAPIDRRSRAHLDAAIAGAIEVFRATHRGTVRIDEDLQHTPESELDALRIQQVVLNLLQNGAESMPEGGTIRVRTRPAPDGGSLLVIEDHGRGIPGDVRERIFEPFFTTKETGTGLGLAIARRIIEEHAGRISVESEPGKGTTFIVWLPPVLPA